MNPTTASSTTSAPPPKAADPGSPESNAGKGATSSTPATALSTVTESKPQSTAIPAASPPSKPENTSAAPPNPWDALRVGSHVVGKYWLPDGQPDGWWIGVITGIEKNDFIIRWPDEPKTPPLKIERKHVAILHPTYDVNFEWVKRRR